MSSNVGNGASFLISQTGPFSSVATFKVDITEDFPFWGYTPLATNHVARDLEMKSSLVFVCQTWSLVSSCSHVILWANNKSQTKVESRTGLMGFCFLATDSSALLFFNNP